MITLEKLAKASRTSLRELRRLSREKENYYRTRTEPKDDGTDRILRIPRGRLKKVQQNIHRAILRDIVLPAHVHSQSGHSHVQHAVAHARMPVILVFDIEDFFPSIGFAAVKKSLQAAGFNNVSARLTARLCTLDGCLPQGAPTSPTLASMVGLDIDVRLKNMCDDYRFTYSRFSDDIAISGGPGLKKARRTIESIIVSEGYTLKSKKCVVIEDGSHHKLVGLRRSGRGFTVPRSYYKNVRSATHQYIRSAAIMTESERGTLRNKITASIAYGRYVERIQGQTGKFSKLEKKIADI